LVATVFTMLSCVLVGLIILTQGSVSGLKAIGVSVLGITLVATIAIDAPELGLWTALVQWLPIIVLAQTLRSSNSLAFTILAGVMIGFVGITFQYLVWTDVESSWINLALQRMEQTGEVQQAVAEQNVKLIQLFVLALVSMAFLIFMLVVLAARWTQARVAESDGFGREFKALVLGKPAAIVAVILLAMSFMVKQPWMNSLSLLLVVAFMFQGIAVLHCKMAARKQKRLLLGLYYVLLLIFPQVVALTAITGVIDNWLVFRKNSVKPDDLNKN
jgi:hypothetical protein